MNGEKEKVVDKFAYLGSTISRAMYTDDEVTVRIVQTIVALERHPANVWERNGIKLKVVVLATILYASEIGTEYQSHARDLNDVSFSCLTHFDEKSFPLLSFR